MFTFDLDGRKALVTGAAGGIGLAIASLLAASGAAVIVADLRATPAGSLPPRVLGITGDVASEAGAESLVEIAVETLGSLDILVNNAGISEPVIATTEQKLTDWQRVIDVNLRGAFLTSRAFGRHVLGRTGCGAIVNISSITGIQGFPASNAYGVSKAGLAQMTKSMATEWARRGIRVNCVAPGFVEAPMAHAMFNESVDRAKIEKRVPMRRLGGADEVAAAVAFLASNAASYITGVVLPVDGGWCAYGGI